MKHRKADWLDWMLALAVALFLSWIGADGLERQIDTEQRNLPRQYVATANQ